MTSDSVDQQVGGVGAEKILGIRVDPWGEGYRMNPEEQFTIALSRSGRD